MKKDLEAKSKLRVIGAKKFIGGLITCLVIATTATGCGFNFGGSKNNDTTTKIESETILENTEDQNQDSNNDESLDDDTEINEEETEEQEVVEEESEEETQEEESEDDFEVPNINDYSGYSIVEALKSAGYDSSFEARAELAAYFGIENYSGTMEQNDLLLSYLKSYAKDHKQGNDDHNSNENEENNNNNNSNNNNNNNNSNNNGKGGNGGQSGNNGGGSGNGGQGGGSGESENKHTHDFNKLINTKVTTNNNGTHKVTRTYKCSADGETKDVTKTESCTYSEWKDAGNGKETRTCSLCGYTQTRDKTHEHNYTNPVVTYEDVGNGTHKVITTKTCSCGATTSSYVIASCDYQYTYKDASHDTATCSKCHSTKTVDHNLTRTGVSTSSTTNKHKVTYSCDHCGHTDIYKEESCTAGSTLYYTSDKLYEYYICTVCGDECNKVAHNHSYGSWTYLNDTTEQRSCACGSTETRAHTYGSPVYAADGLSYTETCSTCGHTRTTAVQHTHSYTAGARQYVGSSDVCYRITYTCSCGDTYTQDYGHGNFVSKSSNVGSDDVCYTTYDECADCGYDKNSQNHDHDYETTDYEFETYYHCKECGHEKTIEKTL